jgi:cytochrome c5
MKKFFILAIAGVFLYACGNDQSENKDKKSEESATSTAENGNPSYDPNRGEGKYTEVDLGTGLDATKAAAGETIYNTKCGSCHKLTTEKLVGPGWSGVTQRRKAVWIMNFITNPDPNISKDPELQAQLEICLVRMPNQNLDDAGARNVLEFMRRNDGVK